MKKTGEDETSVILPIRKINKTKKNLISTALPFHTDKNVRTLSKSKQGESPGWLAGWLVGHRPMH